MLGYHDLSKHILNIKVPSVDSCSVQLREDPEVSLLLENLVQIGRVSCCLRELGKTILGGWNLKDLGVRYPLCR